MAKQCGDLGCFNPTRGPNPAWFMSEIEREFAMANERERYTKRNDKKFTDQDYQNAEEKYNNDDDDDDDEDEDVIPTQDTPTQSPEKRVINRAMTPTKKRNSSSSRDDDVDDDNSAARKISKRIIICEFDQRRHGEFYEMLLDLVDDGNRKKDDNSYYFVAITNEEAVVVCNGTTKTRGLANFSEKLIKRAKAFGAKLSEVIGSDGDQIRKPLGEPVSDKVAWEGLLRPSVITKKRPRSSSDNKVPLDSTTAAPRFLLSAARTTQPEGEAVELPTEDLDEEVWKDIGPKIRDQYIQQVNKQNERKKMKRNDNEIDYQNGNDANNNNNNNNNNVINKNNSVRKESEEDKYRSDVPHISTKDTILNVPNLNLEYIKKRISNCLELQCKKRVDGRLRAILKIISTVRSDLLLTRPKEEEDFVNWVRNDLCTTYPGWEQKIAQSVVY